ncbi:hypothetical protein [Nocardia arizonensis]|uniref:hypothetical protein n=1 Tax=Nocardia arizonensis TaxID=1141647 RepID=UPI0006CF5053|nr:hypothetical protein [Nocardia arizonensis]
MILADGVLSTGYAPLSPPRAGESVVATEEHGDDDRAEFAAARPEPAGPAASSASVDGRPPGESTRLADVEADRVRDSIAASPAPRSVLPLNQLETVARTAESGPFPTQTG